MQISIAGFLCNAGSQIMKTIGKVALVAAMAAMAVSFSSPSYAAKAKKAAAPAACTAGAWQAAGCVGWMRTGQRCGFDGRWYPSLWSYPDATCTAATASKKM
jgi:hypothetical protein